MLATHGHDYESFSAKPPSQLQKQLKKTSRAQTRTETLRCVSMPLNSCMQATWQTGLLPLAARYTYQLLTASGSPSLVTTSTTGQVCSLHGLQLLLGLPAGVFGHPCHRFCPLAAYSTCFLVIVCCCCKVHMSYAYSCLAYLDPEHNVFLLSMCWHVVDLHVWTRSTTPLLLRMAVSVCIDCGQCIASQHIWL